MKRLFVATALMLTMVFIAGTAMAAHADWYFQNTNACISDIWFNGSGSAGSKEEYNGEKVVNGVNGWTAYKWGNKYDSYFEVHGVDKKADMDRPGNNHKLPIEEYYGYELNYLHLDIKNNNSKDNGQFNTPSKFQVYIASDFSWGGYASSKNPVVETLGTFMDFYYMDTTGSDWVFMVDDYVRLGEIIYNGVSYYFDIVSDMSNNKATQLTGQAYEDAIVSSGLDYGTELWGWNIKDGGKVHWKFDIVVTTQDRKPPAVPVPGAVWLMGTGLAGLAVMRRKNKK